MFLINGKKLNNQDKIIPFIFNPTSRNIPPKRTLLTQTTPVVNNPTVILKTGLNYHVTRKQWRGWDWTWELELSPYTGQVYINEA